MPIKRKAPPPPAKRTVRKARTTKPIPAAPEPQPEPLLSGRLLSNEEKRQLILAHAIRREPKDPVQVLSMWAGVAVTVVVIVAGWWWATKPMIKAQVAQDMVPALQGLAQSMNQGSADMIHAVDQTWEPFARKMEEYKQETAMNKALTSLADQVDATGTRGMFAASPTGTASNASGTKSTKLTD